MTPEGAIIEEAEYEEATVWPRDPEDLDEILAILKKYEGRYTITKSETTGKTTRLIVDGMDGDTMYKLQCSPSVSLAYYTEAFYRNYPDLEKIGIVMIEDYARRKPGPIITFAETLNEEGAGTVASIWPRGGKITDEIMSLIKNYGGPYQIIGDMEDCSFIIVEQLDADAMLKIQRCPDVGLAYFNEAYARKFGDKGEPAAPL